MMPLLPESRTERILSRLVQLFDRPYKIVGLSCGVAVVVTWVLVYVSGVPFEWLIAAPIIALIGSGSSAYLISKVLFTFQARIEFQNEQLAAQAAALQTINEALEQTNVELNSFAQTVAHDLKNPLSALSGYANMLLDEWGRLEEEEVLVVLGGIERSASKMVDIVDELLLFSQVRHVENVHIEPMAMDGIIQAVLKRLQEQIELYEAEVVVAQTLPIAWGYGPWVEEVWVNYVSNGLKYGGQPPRLELGGEVKGEMVMFWVKDNGVGLNAAEQTQLFAEFSRLEMHTKFEGTGIGLSIVQRIVRKLGGEVGLESAVGQGSRFYFTLPRWRV